MHILALDEDAALIDAALRRIPRKRRPQLKKVGGSQPDGAGGTVRGLELEEEGVDEDENEHEGPMIERLGSSLRKKVLICFDHISHFRIWGLQLLHGRWL